MAEHNLTQPRVAALALVSLKTVEGWLASPDAASHRRMHPRNLALIRAELSQQLQSAAKKGKK